MSTAVAQKVKIRKLNPVDRTERVSLAKSRDMVYEKFRTNIRILRASRGLSGCEAGEQIGLKHGKRMIDLEYGRTANPSMDEMLLLSKFFNVSIDDLLNKEAKITF